jgi:hypothetical protein
MNNIPIWNSEAPRRLGWERSFVAALEAHMRAPFAWGSSDCLTMVADVAEALTGHNPLPPDCRAYGTAAAAGALLDELGYPDVEKALAATFPAIAPALARRGDCGVVETLVAGRPTRAAVIVLGPAVVGKGGRRAIHKPRTALLAAFAIGAF